MEQQRMSRCCRCGQNFTSNKNYKMCLHCWQQTGRWTKTVDGQWAIVVPRRLNKKKGDEIEIMNKYGRTSLKTLQTKIEQKQWDDIWTFVYD